MSAWGHVSLKKCDAEDDEVIEARVRMKGQEKQWSSMSRRGSGGPGWALDPLRGGWRISRRYPSMSEFSKLTHQDDFMF